MNKKTLQFDDIILNKKEFHRSKEPIGLFFSKCRSVQNSCVL